MCGMAQRVATAVGVWFGCETWPVTWKLVELNSPSILSVGAMWKSYVGGWVSFY